MTANTLYSNFIDATDQNGNLKKDKSFLSIISSLAGGIVRYDLYNELSAGAVYPFVGGSAYSHKFNFMDPQDTDQSKRLSYINGNFEHTVKGIKRSTADARMIDTFIMLSELPDNIHFALYSNDNQQASTNDKDMGTENTYIASYPAGSSNMEASFQGYGTSNKLTVPRTGNGLGVYIANYLTSPELYYDGASLSGTLSNTSTVKSTDSIKLFKVLDPNNSAIGNSCRGYGFISIGLGLTKYKAEKYSHLIRTIQGMKAGRQ